MATRQAQLGKIAVSVSELENPNPSGDALCSIRVFHQDLSQYHLADVELRMKRDAGEFPDQRLLQPDALEVVIAAVKDFFQRNLPKTQPATKAA